MKLVVGNFKMNLNSKEIDEYIEFFKGNNYANVIFAPSFIYLDRFVKNNLKVASQDVSPFEKGAYTGDISALELKSIGVNYAIIGHSERRMYYNDGKYVSDKLNRLFDNDIIPIICIGETKEERENNEVFNVLKREIDEAFKNVDSNKLSKVIMAYEPIWSIGTGLIPTNDKIEEVIQYIKKYISDSYGFDIKVLYGGSVNNSCIDTLENVKIIDGYLVGGCSIKKEEFKKLIEQVK